MQRYDRRTSRYAYSQDSTARQLAEEPRKRRKPRVRPRKPAQKKAKQSYIKANNAQYIYESRQYWQRIPKYIISTSLAVFVCAMAIVLFNGQITGADREVGRATSQLHTLQEANRALEAQIGGTYTLEEIEFIAFWQLGMTLPDPAQVIEINVPRRSHAVLNTQEAFLPQENFLWQDVRLFVSGLFNRLFGG